MKRINAEPPVLRRSNGAPCASDDGSALIVVASHVRRRLLKNEQGIDARLPLDFLRVLPSSMVVMSD